jgi:histidyl-tRNA synthetase
MDLEVRSLKGQMRQANKERVRYCLIVGDEELRRGQATLRDMVKADQTAVALDRIVEYLMGLEGV